MGVISAANWHVTHHLCLVLTLVNLWTAASAVSLSTNGPPTAAAVSLSLMAGMVGVATIYLIFTMMGSCMGRRSSSPSPPRQRPASRTASTPNRGLTLSTPRIFQRRERTPEPVNDCIAPIAPCPANVDASRSPVGSTSGGGGSSRMLPPQLPTYPHHATWKIFTPDEILAALSGEPRVVLPSAGGDDLALGSMADGKRILVKQFHHMDHMEQLAELEMSQDLGELLCMLRPIGHCWAPAATVFEVPEGGNLQAYLTDPELNLRMSWRLRLLVAVEVAVALKSLQESKPDAILHGGLRPQTVFLTPQFHIKLGDAVPSVLAPAGDPECSVGAPDGPQLAGRGGPPSSQMHGYGLMLAQLLTGASAREALQKLRGRGSSASAWMESLGQGGGLLPTWAGAPPSMVDKLSSLALQCCADDPDTRPSLQQQVVPAMEELQRKLAELNDPVGWKREGEISAGEANFTPWGGSLWPIPDRDRSDAAIWESLPNGGYADGSHRDQLARPPGADAAAASAAGDPNESWVLRAMRALTPPAFATNLRRSYQTPAARPAAMSQSTPGVLPGVQLVQAPAYSSRRPAPITPFSSVLKIPLSQDTGTSATSGPASGNPPSASTSRPYTGRQMPPSAVYSHSPSRDRDAGTATTNLSSQQAADRRPSISSQDGRVLSVASSSTLYRPPRVLPAVAEDPHAADAFAGVHDPYHRVMAYAVP